MDVYRGSIIPVAASSGRCRKNAWVAINSVRRWNSGNVGSQDPGVQESTAGTSTSRTRRRREEEDKKGVAKEKQGR